MRSGPPENSSAANPHPRLARIRSNRSEAGQCRDNGICAVLVDQDVRPVRNTALSDAAVIERSQSLKIGWPARAVSFSLRGLAACAGRRPCQAASSRKLARGSNFMIGHYTSIAGCGTGGDGAHLSSSEPCGGQRDSR